MVQQKAQEEGCAQVNQRTHKNHKGGTRARGNQCLHEKHKKTLKESMYGTSTVMLKLISKAS